MEKLFAVDGNWYLHRVFYTQKFDSEDPATSMARRFVSMICADAFANRATNIVVAFDGANIFRYHIYQDYKANRDNSGTGTGVYDHLNGLIEFLAYCGIQVIHKSKYEADDVLGSLATQNRNVVIGCRDKDAYQYVLRPDIALYDSSFKVGKIPKPRTIKRGDIEKLFGVPAELCVDLQTLVGDGIDNIPKLLSRKPAIEGLLRYGSIKEWMAKSKKFRTLMTANKETLLLNRKLVKLRLDLNVPTRPIEWREGQDLPTAYITFKQFCNPRSKGLF